MKMNWKKSYGDGQETDDYVLWLDGEPTETVISGWSGCWWLYVGNEEVGVYPTLKEAKAEIY